VANRIAEIGLLRRVLSSIRPSFVTSRRDRASAWLSALVELSLLMGPLTGQHPRLW
jgi:hypothetical protein